MKWKTRSPTSSIPFLRRLSFQLKIDELVGTGNGVFLPGEGGSVRLRSHLDKYLVGEGDEEHVTQERDGTSRNAQWTMEQVNGEPHVLRFRSCYGRYLTASNEPVLLGATGRKVTQSLPARLDSSLEWDPVRDVVEAFPCPHPATDVKAVGAVPSPAKLLMLESSDPFSAPVLKVDGRSVSYTVADDAGNVNDNVERPHLTFIGTSVPELTQRLKEETKLEDIIVCTRNPLNQHLIPLYLQMPSDNTTVQLVVFDANSKGEPDESQFALQ